MILKTERIVVEELKRRKEETSKSLHFLPTVGQNQSSNE